MSQKKKAFVCIWLVSVNHRGHKDFHEPLHHLWWFADVPHCCLISSLSCLSKDTLEAAALMAFLWTGFYLTLCFFLFKALIIFFSCCWVLVILSTCSVVFSQTEIMAWKGTKQKHCKISSSIPFSQKDKSNLCNKEYLFQSKDIFECDVLKKMLKMVDKRPSPSALIADFITRLLHCGFIEWPTCYTHPKRLHSSECNVFLIQKSFISQGVGPSLSDTWLRADHSACNIAFISLLVIDFKDKTHQGRSNQCSFSMDHRTYWDQFMLQIQRQWLE